MALKPRTPAPTLAAPVTVRLYQDGQEDLAALRRIEWVGDVDSNPGYLVWRQAKSGNVYCRDFGHTYTIVSVIDGSPLTGRPSESYRGVIVGPGGARKDLPGPYVSREAVAEAMWPEGQLNPIGV